MTALCCGIDIGTTNVKLVVCEPGGAVLWRRGLPSPRVADGCRPATDGPSLLHLLQDLLVLGLQAVGGRAPFAAIAITGIGEDGFCVDDRMRPSGPALPWFDDRAAGEASRLPGDPAAGLRVDAARTVAKWAWLHRHRPEQLDGIWLALTDYPAAVWTGRPFMSETLAARTAAYDVFRRAWLPDLLQAAGAPALPPVVPAGTVVGPVRDGTLLATGAVSSETMIVAGGHDHPVAASAIRRIEPRAVVDSMGTAELLYDEIRDPPGTGFDPHLAFAPTARGEAGVACLGVFELTSALRPYEPGLQELLRLPRLEPSGRPPVLPGEKPPVSPLRPDCITAALEGAGLRSRRMLEAIAGLGGATGPVFATGGWSRADAHLSLRADIFGRPIFRLVEDELAAIGAACLAAEGCGRPGPDLAAFKVTRFDPEPGHSGHYERLYAEARARLDAGPDAA